MDAKLKRKWVKALRSGEYRQGSGQLVSPDGENFCCLGVLADVMGCTWGESKLDLSLVPYPPRARKPLANRGAYWLSERRTGLSEDIQEELAAMNDSGKSFKRIALFIEKNA